MTHDAGRRFDAFALLSSVVSDIGELLRKEARLAAAELRERAAATAGGVAWILVGAILAFIGLETAVAGLVVLIARLGLELFWSCFIVAGGAIVLAILLVLLGRAKIGLTPRRTISQLEKDAALVKEQTR